MSLYAEKLTRRLFVSGAAAVAAGPMLIRPEAGYAEPPRPLPADVFQLGVASGDPLSDGVVLWTRLAPQPIAGGGMPDRVVPVEWEIAEDAAFRRGCRSGVTHATPELGHSVHVDVRGLRSDCVYYFRFKAGSQLSPVGRTRTAPASHSQPRNLRFAFASCQDYQGGFYTAYQHLAQEDLAFVAFLGDYIYEGAPNPAAARQHDGTGEPYTLAEYRNRHARYKTDPDLQAAHATFPWIVTFDDHEIDNNWADEIPQDPDLQSPEAFRARRIAAFQAYYEHMPLRRGSLTDGLQSSGSTWNLLANQVMWAQNDRKAGPEQSFDFDNWDGYRAQRKRLLEFFGAGRVANPVVLTGDRHCTWVCDLRPDFDDPSTPAVGAEITGTSITSGGNPNTAAFHASYDPIMAESPSRPHRRPDL